MGDSAKPAMLPSTHERGQFAGFLDGAPGVDCAVVVQRVRQKEGAVVVDRAEDSAIGGEWRNASQAPKEETATHDRRKHSILRCTMQVAYIGEGTKGVV